MKEYTVTGNVIQVQFQEQVQEIESTPIIQEVDKDLLSSIESFLQSVSLTKKGSNRQTIKYGDKRSTVYQYTRNELKKAHKIQNYSDRLDALLRLAAVVRIFTAPASLRMDENLDPIQHVNQISSAHMADEINSIRQAVKAGRM